MGKAQEKDGQANEDEAYLYFLGVTCQERQNL